MVNLLTLAFAVWFVTFIATFLLSGDIYYNIINWWIPIAPLAIFFVALQSVYLAGPLRAEKRATRTSPVDLNGRYLYGLLRNATLVGMLVVAVSGFQSLSVIRTIGVSIFDAQQLRNDFYEKEIIDSLGGSTYIWVNWLLSSLTYAVLTIGVVIDVSRKKLFSAPSVMAILAALFLSLMSGGRGLIFNVIILYCGSWLAVVSIKDLKKRGAISGLLLASAVLLLPFIFQQINRTDSTVDFGIGEWHLIKYFAGPVFALDRLIETGVADYISIALGRPGLSLMGLDTIFVSGFARGVLGLNVESALATTSYYMHNGVEIGNNVIMNAHYTAGSNFYFDFGVLGYLFVNLLMAGGILYFEVKKSRLRQRLFYPAIYGAVFFMVIMSGRWLITDTPEFFFTLLFVYVIHKFTMISNLRAGRTSKTMLWSTR